MTDRFHTTRLTRMKRLALTSLVAAGALTIGVPSATVPAARAESHARSSEAVLEEIDLGIDTWGIAAGEDSVWVQVGDLGAARIDTTTGAVTAEVPGVANLAFDDGRLWAAALDRLLELDPQSGDVVRTIPLPSEGAYLALGYGSIWVPSAGGLLRIDPASGKVVATIGTPSCLDSKQVTTGFGSVWVACKEGSVVRVDAATDTAQATIATGKGAHSLAVGAGALWVTNYQANTVSRIDPDTTSVTATIRGAGAGVGIAFGRGAVWAASHSRIVKIDPASARIVDRLALGGARPFYYDIAFGDGSLWVSTTFRRSVLRIDPEAL